MKMIVNQKLCTGCGICVGACPNNAILLKEGKALVDQAKCSSCQMCAEVCATGALQFTRTFSPPVIEKPRAMEILHPQSALEPSYKQPNWSKTMLSLVGQHLLPPLVDVLAAFVERRLSPPIQERDSMNTTSIDNRPYHRRRQRRGRYSKI